MSRNRNLIKNRRKPKDRYTLDKLTLYWAIIMTIVGAIMIFDASVYQASILHNDPFYFLKHQSIWLLLALLPAIIMYVWDYRKFSKLATPTLVIVIILLILVLIIGIERNGARRWLGTETLNIQPAEFAKIILIIYMSSWLAKTDKLGPLQKVSFKEYVIKKLIPFFSVLLIISLLIVIEPDLGTAIIIFITSLLMYFIAEEDKTHMKKSAVVISLSVIPIIIVAVILAPYRLKRFNTYLSLLLTGKVADPQGSGYQMQQILIGIGSGGFLGKGFGQSRQRFGYLVENTAYTDSIFAVFLEEMGLIGGILLIFAWLFFLWRGFKIAIGAPDKQGKLLAAGITIWLTLQALMNMGANVGLIPLTGVPSPFLTYGGSNSIVTLIGIAILLNISKYSNIGNGK